LSRRSLGEGGNARPKGRCAKNRAKEMKIDNFFAAAGLTENQISGNLVL